MGHQHELRAVPPLQILWCRAKDLRAPSTGIKSHAMAIHGYTTGLRASQHLPDLLTSGSFLKKTRQILNLRHSKLYYSGTGGSTTVVWRKNRKPLRKGRAGSAPRSGRLPRLVHRGVASQKSLAGSTTVLHHASCVRPDAAPHRMRKNRRTPLYAYTDHADKY